MRSSMPSWNSFRNSDHEKKLLAIYQRLLEACSPQRQKPGSSPFKAVVGTILTQGVAWSNVEKPIAFIIRPCLYYNEKAKKLKACLAFERNNTAMISFDFLRYRSLQHRSGPRSIPRSTTNHSLPSNGNLLDSVAEHLPIQRGGPQTLEGLNGVKTQPSGTERAYKQRCLESQAQFDTVGDIQRASPLSALPRRCVVGINSIGMSGVVSG